MNLEVWQHPKSKLYYVRDERDCFLTFDFITKFTPNMMFVRGYYSKEQAESRIKSLHPEPINELEYE